MIWIAHYNYDYEESVISDTDLRVVMEDIAESFSDDDDPYELGDPDFSERLDEVYQQRDWKGFSLYAVDPQTAAMIDLDISKASNAMNSSHAYIQFAAKTQKALDQLSRQRKRRKVAPSETHRKHGRIELSGGPSRRLMPWQ